MLRDIVSSLHRATKRDYIGCMTDGKVEAMRVARNFGYEFWDGSRRYGYGGYRYDGRWKPVAQKLVDLYGLTKSSSVLDIGAGQAHLLYELKQLLPGIKVLGTDISEYAQQKAMVEVILHDAKNPIPYADKTFDLVISLAALHNLELPDVVCALREVERVGRKAYVMVEAYRDEAELFNLQCWAKTAECFFRPQEWYYVGGLAGYTGDWEFIYFEENK